MAKTKFDINSNMLIPFKVEEIRIKSSIYGETIEYRLVLRDDKNVYEIDLSEDFLAKYAKKVKEPEGKDNTLPWEKKNTSGSKKQSDEEESV